MLPWLAQLLYVARYLRWFRLWVKPRLDSLGWDVGTMFATVAGLDALVIGRADLRGPRICVWEL